MQTVKIKDFGKVITGKTPSTKRPRLFGDRYPFITPSDIASYDVFHVESTERGLSEEGCLTQKSKSLPPRTICYVCIGSTVGKICLTKVASFTNQQLNNIIVNRERFVPEYVYYRLRYETPHIQSIAGGTGSGKAIYNKTAFEEHQLDVHDYDLQKKISSILSAYDTLIENNTHRIRILEEMAQNIYQEWFVKFRFPGYENAGVVPPELGTIPEGWEVKPIGEVVDTLGGGTPSTAKPEYWEGGDIVWFIPSDLTRSRSMFITDSEKKITALGLEESSARLFPAYSVMMTSRATIGVTAINTRPACTNQGFITCIPNEKLSAFQIYYWIQDNLERITTIASGATYKEINRTEFRSLPVVVPESETTKLFVKMVEPLGNQIENILSRNAILRRTRDMLLPRLISGELDVGELDIDTEGLGYG